jgi:hypothetical protein
MKGSQAKWDWREFQRPPAVDEASSTRPDPVPIELDGQSGNAFAILSLCREAALTAGWSLVQWDRFYWEATSGNHDELLEVVSNWFDVR